MTIRGMGAVLTGLLLAGCTLPGPRLGGGNPTYGFDLVERGRIENLRYWDGFDNEIRRLEDGVRVSLRSDRGLRFVAQHYDPASRSWSRPQVVYRHVPFGHVDTCGPVRSGSLGRVAAFMVYCGYEPDEDPGADSVGLVTPAPGVWETAYLGDLDAEPRVARDGTVDFGEGITWTPGAGFRGLPEREDDDPAPDSGQPVPVAPE